jgi:hypothetical protein
VAARTQGSNRGKRAAVRTLAFEIKYALFITELTALVVLYFRAL